MKYFSKEILVHEIFRSMVPWATKYFLKNLQNSPVPPPTYIMYPPLEYIKIDFIAKVVLTVCTIFAYLCFKSYTTRLT